MFIPEKPKNFPERLMFLAKSSKSSDIAAWSGVPYNTINNYINTGRMPSAEVLLKIAEYKGVNIHWLLTGSGQPYDQNGQRASPTEDNNITVAPPDALPGEGDLVIHIPAFQIRITRQAGSAALPETLTIPIPLIRAAETKQIRGKEPNDGEPS